MNSQVLKFCLIFFWCVWPDHEPEQIKILLQSFYADRVLSFVCANEWRERVSRSNVFITMFNRQATNLNLVALVSFDSEVQRFAQTSSMKSFPLTRTLNSESLSDRESDVQTPNRAYLIGAFKSRNSNICVRADLPLIRLVPLWCLCIISLGGDIVNYTLSQSSKTLMTNSEPRLMSALLVAVTHSVSRLFSPKTLLNRFFPVCFGGSFPLPLFFTQPTRLQWTLSCHLRTLTYEYLLQKQSRPNLISEIKSSSSVWQHLNMLKNKLQAFQLVLWICQSTGSLNCS